MSSQASISLAATGTIAALIATVAIAPATQAAPAQSTHSLAAKASKAVYTGMNVSTRSDRKKSRLLHKATLKAGHKAFIFVPRRKNIKHVQFSLNGKGVRSELHPPFDFHGGSVKKAWGAKLPAGTHKAKAVVTFTNGTTQTRLATFTVKGKTTKPVKPGKKAVYTGMNVSTRSDRKKSRALHKATLKAGHKTFIFVPRRKNIKHVQFSLNGKAVRTELKPPFDFHGGSVKKAWGAKLPAGTHKAKAVVTFTNGTTQTRLATFTVKGKTTKPVQPGNKAVYTGINVDTSPDRYTSRLLHKATLRGGQKVAVFVPAKKNIRKVVFSLNGKRVRTEVHAPFDMHGGSVQKAWGNVFPAGNHTVQALVVFTNGKKQLRQANFTVTKKAAPKPRGKKPIFMASMNPDRSDAYPLDGDLLTISQMDMCGFIHDTGNIAKVDFYHKGSRYRTDTKAPFDIFGSDSFGNCKPFFSVMHYNGLNKIKAKVHFTNGKTTWVSAQIRRDAAQPHPDFGPRLRFFNKRWSTGSYPLEDGITIEAKNWPSIYLPNDPGYSKVVFTLNGKHVHTDRRPTFTLHKGSFYKAKALKPGSYTIKAKGYYLNPKKHGAKSKTWTTRFHVVK